MRLYSFWRSQATFRVRIALGLKGLAAEMMYVDLLKNEHTGPEYRQLNPAMMLPTLIDGNGPPLVQSLAIIVRCCSSMRSVSSLRNCGSICPPGRGQ
jgi:maleylacetoacetate isomerase